MAKREMKIEIQIVNNREYSVENLSAVSFDYSRLLVSSSQTTQFFKSSSLSYDIYNQLRENGSWWEGKDRSGRYCL